MKRNEPPRKAITRIAQVKILPTLSLPPHGIKEIYALKAVENGTATSEQQIIFMNWLRMQVCGIGALSYNPENDSATAFKEGQRSVAIYLQRFIDEPMESVRRRLNVTTNQS